MTSVPDLPSATSGSRRLSKAQRRIQLLATALAIVREEGADRLTLGHLAMRAGVSKPVAYDHFATRSALLIDLYKSIDMAHATTLRLALTTGTRSFDDTVKVLAATYIHCSADTSGEWHAVGAALAGSNEKGAVYQDLLESYVQLFASVLVPHAALSVNDLKRRCIGLVGAGEALAAAMVRGDCTEAEAAETFAALIRGGVSGATG